jgi:hypothetical protein
MVNVENVKKEKGSVICKAQFLKRAMSHRGIEAGDAVLDVVVI